LLVGWLVGVIAWWVGSCSVNVDADANANAHANANDIPTSPAKPTTTMHLNQPALKIYNVNNNY